MQIFRKCGKNDTLDILGPKTYFVRDSRRKSHRISDLTRIPKM